jgi:hypothetical protein
MDCRRLSPAVALTPNKAQARLLPFWLLVAVVVAVLVELMRQLAAVLAGGVDLLARHILLCFALPTSHRP